MRIDAHHHFWQYNTVEFGWIDDSLAQLRRDFLPGDLQSEISAVDIAGTVAVQARQTLQETQWLLSLTDQHDFIRGVVGWVPLSGPDIRRVLAELASHPRVKGVRHVVQDEPDDAFLLRKDFNAGVSALREFGLVYDILIFERQLPCAIEFVDRHPEQVFVLDHIAKPRIKDGAIDAWAAHLCKIAERPNVYCKISGMVTEADHENWSLKQLKPYWDMVFAAFGVDRVMFGSDWPVCTVACDYERWFHTVMQLADPLSPSEQASLLGDTAHRVYNLNE